MFGEKMFNSDLIWSEEEYKAICEYKGNSFAIMNVLLNRNVSKRELRGNMFINRLFEILNR